MEDNADKMSKPKRVRLNPIRKWSVQEERLLLEILMENREFEKPIAQTYYKRFCLEKRVTMDWHRARAKVRNLRVSYNKAKAWEGSTGEENMDASSIKSTLCKMCSYFDELEDIFGNRIIECTIIEDSLDSGSQTTSDLAENFFDITTDTSQENFPTQENLPSTSRKEIYSRTAVADIMVMQTQMMEIKKRKLDIEKDLKERELAVLEKNIKLKEKEIELKEKEINNQKDLKMLEIETQKQLKLSELEMKERLAMEELRLMYLK